MVEQTGAWPSARASQHPLRTWINFYVPLRDCEALQVGVSLGWGLVAASDAQVVQVLV